MYYKTVKKAPRQIHISQLFEDKSIINSNDHGDCMAALIIAIRWEEAGGLKQNRTCSWNESETNQVDLINWTFYTDIAKLSPSFKSSLAWRLS